MIPGYQIGQELHRGKRRIVYRARREHDDKPVLIKTVLGDFPDAAEDAGLHREHEILQHLQSEGIVKLCGLERRAERPALILEDIGGALLRRLIDSKEIGIAAFLNIGIQLSNTLAVLHQHNIIHKGFTPANIIVNLETNQAQVIDFSMATRLPQESQKISHPNLLADALAYMSPEQTGRMNRALDYRTDFYSLGVTFYEMLTGRLPFYSDDALELVHSHIAKIPPAPHALNPAVPQAISDIVMKLLAKTAEERYQSAYGLKADLEICLEQWQAHGRIAGLLPGQKDFSDRFQIPQKLYGREPEIAILMSAFDRVAQGESGIMLVSGYSGIGKSALVNEVHKPIVRQRGYFIAGKFDQFKRNIPYSAVIQAFQELVRQLFTENEAQIAAWKDKLIQALGPNGQVLIDVIPEVELILGAQPAVPELPPAESQNRFNLVFQRFIQVFTQKEHPLVIFLDDLQWADSATLKLLQVLTTDPNSHYLFLIGAYRDNEVSAAHPLLLALAEIEKAGAKREHLILGPLHLTQLNQFVADTLCCETEKALPLSALVLQKTAGNPFFVTQFLHALHQEKLLELDYRRGCWQFDLAHIQRVGMTDNVVELMAGKIQRLANATQQVVKFAACIGNQFDLKTLAMVNKKSLRQTADDLGEAVREGLIVPMADFGLRITDAGEDSAIYRFLHDRVQQAAYALIPDEQKKVVHLQAGRLLLAHCSETERLERLFDIVNHLNSGMELIVDIEERAALAGLNLQAGQKAKSAAAYKPALSYFNHGLHFLSDQSWVSHYNLAFALQREQAECEYLCGNFATAENCFDLLLRKAQTSLERAEIHNLRAIQYENMAKYLDAVSAGREGLRLFGIVLPETDEKKKTAVNAEMQAIQEKLGGRKIEALIHLPVMADPEIKMCMKLLMTIWAPAYIAGDGNLVVLISAIMVRLSLQHGNTEASTYGYVTHAITVGSGLRDYKSGYEFGRLALAVNDKFHDLKLRAKAHHMFSCFVNFWRMPIKTCFPYSKDAFRSGLETGDFAYATYAAIHESWHAFFSDCELNRYQKDYRPNLVFLTQIKNYSFADAQRLLLHWGLSFQGLTETPFSFSDQTFDENAYLQAYQGAPFFETFYYVTKLNVFYVFENYAAALEMAQKAEGVIHALFGTLWMTTLCFYHGLTLAALCAEAEAAKQRDYWQKLETLQKPMQIWAENCPENFQHEYLLLSAEMARLAGNLGEAMAGYEQAIQSARENGIIQHEALANELYAKFWLQRHNTKLAGIYLTEAYYRYQQWGAAAKAGDLAERYPHLLRSEGAISRLEPPTVRSKAESLDLNTVSKASQVISGEMVLSRLVEKLINIAIENAGAQKGLLLLDQDGELVVAAASEVDKKAKTAKAEKRANDEEMLQPPAVKAASGSNLPLAMMNLVRRTGESLVLADATTDGRFPNDPYVMQNQPKSVLCIPILLQSKFVGILYLENNLVAGAFTPDHIEVMQILCAQAAISLENARLYDEVKQEFAERKRAEETLRAIVEGTAAVTGTEFFHSLVKHLAEVFHVRYAFVAECTDATKTAVRTVSFLESNNIGENFTFALEGTPCEKVIGGQAYYHPEKLYATFPKAVERESYFGMPIHDSQGQIIGHLAIVHDRPMSPEPPPDLAIMKIFAARAGAELERKRAEDALKQALAELERLKNRIQEENIYLQEEIKKEYNFDEIIGNSAVIKTVFQNIEKVARTDSTVLLTGETGTGKELVANAIHTRSPRHGSALIKVNCAALPAGLIESELFGHEKGAFTGATARKKGRFELADGGTLLLDEVGELPLETQVKLLRVLQEQEFERVGGAQTLKVNVRVIAATNRHLEDAVKHGSFRADLFYRLNIFPIPLPALRERPEDIPALAHHFVGKFARRTGKRVERIAPAAMEALRQYHWPGNIREMANILERAVILCDGGTLLKEHIAIAPRPGPKPEAALLTLEENERALILKALAETNWVIGGANGAAQRLGLNRTTLLARMKKLGIERHKE